MTTGKPHLFLVAALLGLAAFSGERACGQELHDSVVIVLDASGSMSGGLAGTKMDKMTAAKSALKEVLQQVPESTHIGLLVFSSASGAGDWFYPLGLRVNETLMKAIETPQPGGGTPLGAYIKKGADRLLEERAKQYGYGSYRLLIVTDGEAGDRNLVEKHTPEVIARGITMDVIGVGMTQDHTLATRVHSYRRADDPAALSRAIAEVFAEVAVDGTDIADAEAFDMIAPIPLETASALLQALSTSGNHPIGEQIRPPGADPRPGATGASPSTSRGRRFPVWLVVIAVLFFVQVIRLLSRKGSGR